MTLQQYQSDTMIILFAGQKGGSGKSTLASNSAAWLARKGKDVMLVDADRQGTCSRWSEYREEDSNLPVVQCVQKYERITKALKDLDSRYEYVICDVAGRDSTEMRSASWRLILPLFPSDHHRQTSIRCHTLLRLCQQHPTLTPT